MAQSQPDTSEGDIGRELVKPTNKPTRDISINPHTHPFLLAILIILQVSLLTRYVSPSFFFSFLSLVPEREDRCVILVLLGYLLLFVLSVSM
ncbi:MAG: hypothetical protein JOS17DRAFT_743655, partial [Linnemannia elongata]